MAFIDSRTRKGLKKTMLPDQCKDLHDIIFNLMVGVALDKEKKNNSDDRNETNNAYEPTPPSGIDHNSLTYVCVRF